MRVNLKKTPQKCFYGDKKLQSWLNNVPQKGFLNYFDDSRHQYKKL